MQRASVAATQWNVLMFLHGHTVGKSGRDVDGRIANGLVKRGLVVKRLAYGKRGGRQQWYELTMAGLDAVQKTLHPGLRNKPHTHDEDLAGALEERERLHVPQARKLQQMHDFVSRKPSWDLCDRCGKMHAEGAHPRKTKRELAQEQRVAMDQLISNAEKDFSSLESNLMDMDDFENYDLTKSQQKRLQSLKDDLDNLLTTTLDEWT